MKISWNIPNISRKKRHSVAQSRNPPEAQPGARGCPGAELRGQLVRLSGAGAVRRALRDLTAQGEDYFFGAIYG